MNHKIKNYQLYLVTDENSSVATLEEALQGGVTMVQLREKNLSSQAFYHKALVVQHLTKAYGVPLIINDRLDIALAIKADGVHLGQSDLPVAVARKLLGRDMIIGASTATVEEALQAKKQGADYLGVGAMFSTSTKKNTRPVSVSTLESIIKAVDMPVVAIGGITEKNLPQLMHTGLSGIALVSEILNAQSPKVKAETLRQILNQKGGLL